MRRSFLGVVSLVVASLALTVVTVPVMAQASIDLNVKEGHVGDTIVVGGKGFSPTTKILLKYDDMVLRALETLNDGSLEDNPVEIPQSTAGNHAIRAVRASDGTLLASEVFTVIPELTLDPERGPSGSLVIATGTGYASQSDITVEWSSSVSAEVSVQGSSSGGSGGGSSGCNGRFKLAVKVTAEVKIEAGVSTKAIDNEGNAAEAIFTLVPEVPPVLPVPVPPVPPMPVPPVPPTPPNTHGPSSLNWLLPIIIIGILLVIAIIVLVHRTRRVRF